ncbi:Bestrophin, RFP-TM, chloride channel-domain-containing protein [Crucibulum laeve]|uniref:Bestrophin, RFP-TM, chloride channel-domain-containing protein n=1 Tax=Crucibulum laeve TaxID=68775 RepID=A0A5C3LUJ4_9AGAR|nr:Bestrophin, RFP-TM, chloride channel-domain-containing protein [Crucibulum laeve]
MSPHLKSKRSSTGFHPLLPASRPGTTYEAIPRVPTYSLITWTFGRGSVIWRIWPAVLLHTIFACGVVTVSMRGILHLEIPSVMLTVLGVVIGFVISYRAMSGYDRYWMGRTCWSDVIRDSRALGRLIWFHVPPRFSNKTAEEVASGQLQRSTEELSKAMSEKRMALDLVEGFAVALKHHIRGELGIYYEDLYHLVRPMHDHEHTAHDNISALSTSVHSPRKAQRIAAQPLVPQPQAHSSSIQDSLHSRPSSPDAFSPDPIIPAINAYGTFDDAGVSRFSSTGKHHLRRAPSSISSHSANSTHRPLLPSSQPREEDATVMGKVSGDLIPFVGFLTMIKSKFSNERPLEVLPPNVDAGELPNQIRGRQWQGPVHSSLHAKHRPRVAGGGENLPVEILRCLSEWFSVLEDRGTVPGTSLGSMIGTIAAFEDSLTVTTVWVYLFFLPFQLVSQFGYYTIPGVAIAAFMYLGFNDLDLDLFCHAIIHADIKHLKTSPCLNAYLGPTLDPRSLHRRSTTLVELSEREHQDSEIEGVVTGFTS